MERFPAALIGGALPHGHPSRLSSALPMTDQPNQPLRLRAEGADRPFEVVLVEPEIPPNTGNVARLCAATGAALHLVGKLGFRIDEQAVRRAGLDYWHLVKVYQHADLAAAEGAIAAGRPPVRRPGSGS